MDLQSPLNPPVCMRMYSITKSKDKNLQKEDLMHVFRSICISATRFLLYERTIARPIKYYSSWTYTYFDLSIIKKLYPRPAYWNRYEGHAILKLA